MLDAFVVLLFLMLTLIGGLGHSKQLKTLEDYALGGRNFSTWALVATISATWLGGSTIMTGLSRTYADGITYVVPYTVGVLISLLILTTIFIPRMSSYLGKLSIADALGSIYGTQIRIIVAVAGLIGGCGFIAAQFKVFGIILTYFTEISEFKAIIISAFIVTIYSSVGGLRAVAFTDIIQIVMFGLAIPTIGIILWNYTFVENISLTSNKIDQFSIYMLLPNLNLSFWSMISLMLYATIPCIDPAIFQRISMGRNVRQVQKAFIYATFIITLIYLAVDFIPFLLYRINPNIANDKLLDYILTNYIYTGFKGLIVSGIIAMAMSTADSYINSSSVLFTNDICKPLGLKQNNELLTSKLFAVFMGIIGTVMALSGDDLLGIILTASAFYKPIVSVPMMLTILGFRGKTISIILGMTGGLFSIIIWKYLLKLEPDPIAFAMLINFLTIFIAEAFFNKSRNWQLTPVAKNDFSVTNDIKEFFQAFFSVNPLNFITKYSKNAPKLEHYYAGLGSYFLLYTLITIYNTQNLLIRYNLYQLSHIYVVMIVTSTLMLTYPIWPPSINKTIREKIISYLWPITLFVMLILINTIFAIVSAFQGLQLAIFTANLILVTLLLGWRIGLQLIIVVALLFALLNQYFFLDSIIQQQNYSPISVFLYALLLICICITIFIRPQQNYLEEMQNETLKLKNHIIELTEDLMTAKDIKRRFLQIIHHETNIPLMNIAAVTYLIQERDQENEIPRHHMDTAFSAIENGSQRLQAMINNLVETASFERGVATVNIKKADIIKTLRDSVSEFENKLTVSIDIPEQDAILIPHDHIQIKNVFRNLLKDVYWYVEERACTITVTQNSGYVTFEVISPHNPLIEDEIDHLFEMFYQGSAAQQKQKGIGLGLYLCDKIIRSHNGFIKAKAIDGRFSIEFSLPV